MPDEHLAHLWVNIHRTGSEPVCLTESISLNPEETRLVKFGLFLWCCVVDEEARCLLTASSYSSFGGRLREFAAAKLRDPRGFAPFLELLDAFDDIVLETISSDGSRFKAEALLSKLCRLLSDVSPDLWRLLAPVLRPLIGSELTPQAVAALRQMACLLSKLGIDRSDLLSFHSSEYLAHEKWLVNETLAQEAGDARYNDIVRSMRSILDPVIKGFSLDPRLVKHGPGAVADPSVKGSVAKFLAMGHDARIGYLLSKEGSVSISDLSPFDLTEATRTSRVVFVKKTWKKLRGISAEPVELQYFQQAVFRSLERALSDTPLHHVIRLREQEASGDLALRGSRDGSLATIDLTSASDSVTLRLVRDVFGNTSLCRWLLATRSTHTLLNGELVKLAKFGPMGSAVCFPVECLIFAAATLASVAGPLGCSLDLRDYQVYGDDIICPSRHSHAVADTLRVLGFSVNNRKSFHTGDFRESCGVEAWHGVDITPLRLKEHSFDFDGSIPCSYDHHTRSIDLLNALYLRGYKRARSFLLEKFLACPISVGGRVHRVEQSVVFGDGSRGDIVSPCPTNFQVERAPVVGLFRLGYRRVMWRPRYRFLAQAQESDLDEVHYFEWLLRKSGDACAPVKYDLKFFQSIIDDAPKDLMGLQMIPTVKTWDPWYDF